MRIKKGIDKICEFCGNSFYAYPYNSDTRKYCSTECSNKANAPKLSQDRIGSGNPRFGKRPWNYKDGTSGHRPWRYNFEYFEWRRKVFTRDKQTCQNCLTKLKRKDCIAHHIKCWSKFPKLRYTVYNGITYCRKCHNIIDPLIKAKQF